MNNVTESTMCMPAETKEKWLKALRSGKYEQGSGSLKTRYFEKYCCLGVLEMELDGKVETSKSYPYETRSLGLPSSKWLTEHGIHADPPFLSELANMNDGVDDGYNPARFKQSFAQIADFIEKTVGVLDEE